MFDPGLTNTILVWLGGQAAVRALTSHIVKALDKLNCQLHTLWGYLVSVSLSVIITATFLWATDQFSGKSLVLYAVAVWVTASGIYDSAKSN